MCIFDIRSDCENTKIMKTVFNSVVVVMVVSMAVAAFSSCKKEVPPRLVITVTDTINQTLSGAEVWVYHGNPNGTGSGIHNDDHYSVKKTTESNGTASFDIPNSAVLDVIVTAPLSTPNPPFPPIVDTLSGKKVVKVELKWQRSKENVVNETVICD